MNDTLVRETAPVDTIAMLTGTEPVSDSVSIITLDAPDIAASARPGNFVNIKINEGSTQPLLRRPFSIHNVRGNLIDLMIKSVGTGSTMLRESRPGSLFRILGPLGNAFGINDESFATALLVSGGIGTAPMLFLQQHLLLRKKTVINLVGGRNSNDLLTRHLENCNIATDDGSAGFKGSVVSLLEQHYPGIRETGPVRIFACGPHPMLKAIADFCVRETITGELSLESIMGCGIGICYGCNCYIRTGNDDETDTILLCRKGPVLEAKLLAD